MGEYLSVVRETALDSVNKSTGSAPTSVVISAETNSSGPTRGWEIFDELSDYQCVKKNSRCRGAAERVLEGMACVFCLKCSSCNFKDNFLTVATFLSKRLRADCDCPSYFALNTSHSGTEE